MFKTVKVMQNPLLHRRIGVHCKRQDASGISETTRTLQERPSEGICFGELPQSGAFLRSSTLTFMNHHMKLSQKIMGQHRRHHVQMVAMQSPDRNIVKVALRLQFADCVFLRTAAIVKEQNLLHGGLLVSRDHLELITVFVRDEQIKLNRLFGLYFDPFSYEEEPEAAVPFLGLPLGIKIGKFTVEITPASSALNHLLEFRKPLKRHGDGKLDALILKLGDDLIAEKGTVHTRLYNNAGTSSTYGFYTFTDKFKSAVGIMDIAGTGKNVKDLGCLSYHTKQRVIASLPLLLFVKTDRRAFCQSPCRQHRAVKIQSHSDKTKRLKSRQHHLTASPANLKDAFVINQRQCPADGGNIRKPSKPQKTKRHEIIPIVFHVPKTAIAQHQMNNKHENDSMTTKQRVVGQMIETGFQFGFQIQFGKQRLNDYQSGRRRKPLVFKTKLRNAMDTGENLCFTISHYQWPPVLVDFVCRDIKFNQSGGCFARFYA